MTEHSADGSLLRVLATFGNAAVKDDVGVRGIAVRSCQRWAPPLLSSLSLCCPPGLFS